MSEDKETEDFIVGRRGLKRPLFCRICGGEVRFSKDFQRFFCLSCKLETEECICAGPTEADLIEVAYSRFIKEYNGNSQFGGNGAYEKFFVKSARRWSKPPSEYDYFSWVWTKKYPHWPLRKIKKEGSAV